MNWPRGRCTNIIWQSIANCRSIKREVLRCGNFSQHNTIEARNAWEFLQGYEWYTNACSSFISHCLNKGPGREIVVDVCVCMHLSVCWSRFYKRLHIWLMYGDIFSKLTGNFDVYKNMFRTVFGLILTNKMAAMCVFTFLFLIFHHPFSQPQFLNF